MGNSIQKYYKKYDNHETNTYYFNLGKSLFVPCPRVCHFCMGYLDEEEYVATTTTIDIETGRITPPQSANSFEDYDIVSNDELI